MNDDDWEDIWDRIACKLQDGGYGVDGLIEDLRDLGYEIVPMKERDDASSE